MDGGGGVARLREVRGQEVGVALLLHEHQALVARILVQHFDQFVTLFVLRNLWAWELEKLAGEERWRGASIIDGKGKEGNSRWIMQRGGGREKITSTLNRSARNR